MAKTNPPKGRGGKKPTDAELEILQVLWERGRSTVREVLRTLQARREVGYTTVLKTMQIMADKGLVERDETVRPQQYRAVPSQKHTQRQALGDLLERLYQGAAGPLVMQALAAKRASAEELAEIRELLDTLEAEQGDES